MTKRLTPLKKEICPEPPQVEQVLRIPPGGPLLSVIVVGMNDLNPLRFGPGLQQRRSINQESLGDKVGMERTGDFRSEDPQQSLLKSGSRRNSALRLLLSMLATSVAQN